MKTTITMVLMFLFMDPITAIKSNFEKDMKDLIEMKAQAQTEEDFLTCADGFLSLQKKYEKEWLPSYYAVTCYLSLSMDEKLPSSERDAWVNTAKAHMAYLTVHFPQEPEVWILQSWYYAAYLMIDPMSRGMSFGQKSTTATQQALKMDPSNPRAQYLNFQNILGRAPYTGEDTSSLCQDALKSLQKFDDYPIKSDIYPTWGKAELQAIVNQCKY